MGFSIIFTSSRQECLWNSETYCPRICLDPKRLTHEHNAVVISLDVSPLSTLNWKEAIERARTFIGNNLLIVWELRMAKLEIHDDFIFQTLACAVEHFLRQIWNEFHAHSLGVLDYAANSEIGFESWCTCLRYLYAPLFSCDIPLFLLCDSDLNENILLNRDFLPGFILGVTGSWQQRFPYSFPALAWNEKKSPIGFIGHPPFEKIPQKQLSLGLLLPPYRQPGIHEVFEQIKNHHFRIIPERLLTQEWEGLNELIVFVDGLSSQGRRKVLGFQAAGGRIITVNGKMSSNEISLTDYLDS